MIFIYRISRTRRIVENTFGAMCLVFRFITIPILLFIRLRGHLIEKQIDNLSQVHGRITQDPMRCSLSETHLDEPWLSSMMRAKCRARQTLPAHVERATLTETTVSPTNPRMSRARALLTPRDDHARFAQREVCVVRGFSAIPRHC
ncbi:hypothetical protein PR048_023860 [Dryococelus australis]|uniref:Uncharacterized protein n=1 Tax=Dryococelus australis TaxID=614101 RepID=A0ABQ9GV99_9NEOP|nr:hypothetical protein PR048_023860 [Dryococelus australis]